MAERGLNPMLMMGATLVLMPRFNVGPCLFAARRGIDHDYADGPPAMNAFVSGGGGGQFPRNHKLHWVKSGAAPLAPELREVHGADGILVAGLWNDRGFAGDACGYLEPDFTAGFDSDMPRRRRSVEWWGREIFACVGERRGGGCAGAARES